MEVVKVCRPGKVIYVRGRPTDGKMEEFIIEASIQPLTGKEVLQLEEGDRRRQHLYVFTKFQLERNDIVIRDGKNYETQEIEDWTSFVRARIVLEDVGVKRK